MTNQKPRAISCPQCGSTLYTQIESDKYRCEHCYSVYILAINNGSKKVIPSQIPQENTSRKPYSQQPHYKTYPQKGGNGCIYSLVIGVLGTLVLLSFAILNSKSELKITKAKSDWHNIFVVAAEYENEPFIFTIARRPISEHNDSIYCFTEHLKAGNRTIHYSVLDPKKGKPKALLYKYDFYYILTNSNFIYEIDISDGSFRDISEVIRKLGKNQFLLTDIKDINEDEKKENNIVITTKDDRTIKIALNNWTNKKHQKKSFYKYPDTDQNKVFQNEDIVIKYQSSDKSIVVYNKSNKILFDLKCDNPIDIARIKGIIMVADKLYFDHDNENIFVLDLKKRSIEKYQLPSYPLK